VATPLLPSESAASQGTGTVIVTLWCILLLAWAVSGLLDGGLRIRGGIDQAAVLVFSVWLWVSGLGMARSGQPRATLNACWVWLSLAIGFFLARQLLDRQRTIRALVAVMISLAVGLSVHGYHQYFWSLPQAREEYAADPDKVLREAGIEASPGSPERRQFEDRLGSTEPIATFTLTNSLAGFLTAWLIVLVGIAATAGLAHESSARTAVAVAACGLIITGCWVLTKSRSAWLATIIGASVLAGMLAVRQWKPRPRYLWSAAALIALASGFGVLSGGLDRLVITEAFKSFAYRIEYWRATAAMIGQHPWLGCGPGNFQAYYTSYKLPGASETVADPHNFLLEVWATMGTPGMLAFLAILIAAAWELRAGFSANNCEETEAPPATREIQPICWGAATGLLIAFFPCGYLVGSMPDFAVLLFGAPLAIAAFLLWLPWVMHGRLDATIPVLAAATLSVNLCAAGGISFPGVAGSLWLLIAAALNLVPSARRSFQASRAATALFALAALGLVFACQLTMYEPVLTAGATLERGIAEWSEGRLNHAEQTILEAADADRWSDEPWKSVAALRHQRWSASGDRADFPPFQDAATRMLELNPHSSRAFSLYTEWLVASYLRNNDPRDLELASQACRKAVELYPNDSLGHARLAVLARWGGDSAEAARQADAALRLDAVTPHAEQKLKRRPLFPFPTRLEAPSTNTEQLMVSLRSSSEPQ
jgi:O-antigen ligase